MDLPLIKLENISRTFAPDHNTGIRDVNLEIYAGEFVAIVGPSGAGKSTLLNLIGLLDRPDSGRYTVGGRETHELNERERERDKLRSLFFGFVFQSTFVLADETSIQNAALGLRIQRVPLRERSDRARRALELLGIADQAAVAGKLLSGGERQRLAIARAMATEPRVILADEPTGNLDSTNSLIVLDHLRSLNRRGTTIILITHDQEVASQADRRIMVTDGLVYEEQPHRPPERAVAVQSTHPHREHNSQSIRSTSSTSPQLAKRTTFLEVAADDFGDAVSAMTSRRIRTLLLMCAFVLGIGGLITSIGLSETASNQVSERLTQAALDEVRITLPGGGELLAAHRAQLNTWIHNIEQLPHVQRVGWVATVGASSAQIRRLYPQRDDTPSNLQLIAASPNYLTLMDAELITGTSLEVQASPLITSTAWLGRDAAAALRTVSPGPGSTVWVFDRRLTIAGVIQAGTRNQQLNRTIILSPDALAGAPEVSVAIVVRTDTGYPVTLADAIPIALDPADPGRFRVETVADLRKLRIGVADDLSTFVGILSAVLLLLASTSAATTMHLTVHSRSQEIALRRAIGSTRIAVARLFLIEGIIIGIVGGALGGLIGTSLTLLVATLRNWTAVLPPFLSLTGILIGAITGALSALIPAHTASKKEPADAIR